MSKAEQFIKDYTRHCSNELCAVEDRYGKKVISYHEWLTPEQALRAVEIARNEVIDKACEWLVKSNIFNDCAGNMEWIEPFSCRVEMIDSFRKIFENEESENTNAIKEISELIMWPSWKTEKEFRRRKELIAWLEKQKEGHWKPSDKQMESVKKAFRELFARDLVDEDFVSLINDLKNL